MDTHTIVSQMVTMNIQIIVIYTCRIVFWPYVKPKTKAALIALSNIICKCKEKVTENLVFASKKKNDKNWKVKELVYIDRNAKECTQLGDGYPQNKRDGINLRNKNEKRFIIA